MDDKDKKIFLLMAKLQYTKDACETLMKTLSEIIIEYQKEEEDE